MPPENKIFGLEGIDGTGKTTAGKLIAQQIGGRYFYCMEGHPLAPYRKKFDTAPVPVRFLYYLAIPWVNYSKLEKMREEGPVCEDRTIWSTIAYHKAYGLPDFWFNLIPSKLRNQIDTTIYFTATEEERKRRVLGRVVDDNTMTESDRKSFEFAARIDAAYRDVLPKNSLIVDTTGKRPESVTREVVSRL